MPVRVARRIRLFAGTLASVLAVSGGAALAEPAVSTVPLPSGVKSGSGIVTDGAGQVWFGVDDVFGPSAATPRIGRFDPAQAGGADGGITTYPTPTFAGAPCCATRVTGLAFDAVRNRLWIVRNDGLYGFATPSELTPGSSATGFVVDHLAGGIGIDSVALDAAADGVWITENTTTNVASPPGSGYFPGARAARVAVGPGIVPSLQLFESKNLAQQQGQSTLDSLRYDAKPSGIASDGQGGAWFGEADAGNPGWRIAHAQGAGYTEYQLPCLSNNPCSGSFGGSGGPNSVSLTPDGAVWFTIPLSKSIGRFDGGTFTTYSLSGIAAELATGNPLQLRTAPDGTLWLVVSGAPGAASNAIVRIVPTATPTATVYPVTAGRPISVAASTTDVWFTLSSATATGQLGRIAGAISAAPPASGGTPTPTPTPGGNAPTSTPAPGAVMLKSASVARPSQPKVSGDTASFDQQCVGPPSDPCALVFIVSANEFVRGFPGTRPRAARTAAAAPPKKPVVLGQLSVTLKGGERRTIKVRLSKKARKALAVQGSIKTKVTVTQVQPDGTSSVISTKKLTFKRKR